VAAGVALCFDERSRMRRGVVIGGSPLVFLRLSARGAQLVHSWRAGTRVGPSAAEGALAARLVDTGVAYPLVGAPGSGPGRDDVDVVIPVRDQPGGLAVTVASLGPVGGLVVVDDGSADPAAAAANAGPGARVLRHPQSRGPAAARNRGWRAATRPLIAFIDADCVAPPDWLEGLLPLFCDPRVAAVAPRIAPRVAPGTPAALGVYDRLNFPLDMGPRPGPVRPRSWVPYVPTACVIVRRACLEAANGFDEQLRAGEDVDLVWRLAAAGWALRYEPAVTVTHPVRATRRAWAAQRFSYGRSAADLAARHGDAVAPLQVSPWSATAWSAGALIHPLLGAVVAGASAVAVTRGRAAVPAGELLRAAASGHVRSGSAVARVLGREWWPFALAAAGVSRRVRRAWALALLAPPLAGWVRRRPPIDPLRWCALAVADGACYGAGVWAGCLRRGSIDALRPRWSRAERADHAPPGKPRWRTASPPRFLGGHPGTPT